MTWSMSIRMGVNAVLEQSPPQISGSMLIQHKDLPHRRPAIRNSTTACILLLLLFSFYVRLYGPARLSIGTELNKLPALPQPFEGLLFMRSACYGFICDLKGQ